MKISLTVLLLIGFITPTFGQASRKIMAENIRNSERIVKGAPFSAEAITESIQTLVDGNKIVRNTTSRIYRDTEGRYRREDMPRQLGLPGAVVEMPESILILDPVAGLKYTLNPKKNTARLSPLGNKFLFNNNFDLKFKLFDSKLIDKDAKLVDKKAKLIDKEAKLAEKNGKLEERAALQAQRAEMQAERAARQAERAALQAERAKLATEAETEKRAANNVVTDSLGVQNIEGVEAEGTRTTTTIPAGSIGNERDINIVYEKWYSKDLQMIVLSKHYDPGFGEQTYRLTNIRREEPSLSLFSIPPGYEIVESDFPSPKPVPSVKPRPSAPAVKSVSAIVPTAPVSKKQ